MTFDMRNLAQYPIKPREVVECLEALAREFEAEERIGDMRPLLLKTAVAVIAASQGVLSGIDERLDTTDPRDWLRYVTPWDQATKLIEAFNLFNPRTDIKEG